MLMLMRTEPKQETILKFSWFASFGPYSTIRAAQKTRIIQLCHWFSGTPKNQTEQI